MKYGIKLLECSGWSNGKFKLTLKVLKDGSMPEGSPAGCSWSGVPKGTVRLVGWSVARAGVQLLTNYFTSFSTPVEVWGEGRPAREDAIPTWRYREDMEQHMP